MSVARMAKEDGWVSLQAAADEIGVSPMKVLALCIKGDLVGKHVAGRTVVRRDSMDAYQAARREEAA